MRTQQRLLEDYSLAGTPTDTVIAADTGTLLDDGDSSATV